MANQTVLQTMKSRGVQTPTLSPSPYQPTFDDKLRKSTMPAPYTPRTAY